MSASRRLALGLVLLAVAIGGCRDPSYASYIANRSDEALTVVFQEDQPDLPLSVFAVGDGLAGTAVSGMAHVGWRGLVTVYGPRCAVIGSIRLEGDDRAIVIGPDLSVRVEGSSALSGDEKQHLLPEGELLCDSP